jgi:hypothetical protein
MKNQERLLGQIVQTKKELGNPKLPAAVRNTLLMLLVALVGLFAKSCKDPEPTPTSAQKPTLTGSVTIDGIPKVNEELTATINSTNGTTGKFTYKWTRSSDTNVILTITEQGTTSKYTITDEDIDCTLGVIVSNEGTNGIAKQTKRTEAVAKNQGPAIINLSFGDPFTANVRGCLTNTQWNGAEPNEKSVAEKVESAFNNAYNGAMLAQSRYRDVFKNNDVVIIVEKAPDGKTLDYTNWKTTGDGKTLKVNFDSLDDLQSNITAAVNSMYTTGTTVGKAIQPTHDRGYVAYNRERQRRDNRFAEMRLRGQYKG